MKYVDIHKYRRFRERRSKQVWQRSLTSVYLLESLLAIHFFFFVVWIIMNSCHSTHSTAPGDNHAVLPGVLTLCKYVKIHENQTRGPFASWKGFCLAKQSYQVCLPCVNMWKSMKTKRGALLICKGGLLVKPAITMWNTSIYINIDVFVKDEVSKFGKAFMWKSMKTKRGALLLHERAFPLQSSLTSGKVCVFPWNQGELFFLNLVYDCVWE